MPDKTAEELLAESRALRERVATQRQARGMNDSDATLRDRASRALDRINGMTDEARGDYNDPKAVRERAQGRLDPVLQAKFDKQDQAFAEVNRELRLVTQTLAARRITGDDANAERGNKPEYQAYRGAFRNWVRGATDDGPLQAAIRPAFQAAAITSDDTSGGFLVPFELETQIERVLQTVCAMRGLATVRGMSTPVYKKPINVGGANGGWVMEQSVRPQTATPRLVMLEFPVFEYYAMPAASQTMFDDEGFDVESWLADEVSIIATESEGDAFINGDGVTKPRGFLTYNIVPNSGYPTKDSFTPQNYQQIGYIPTGVAADLTDTTHNGEDALIDLVHSLRPGYRNNAPRFLMNDLTLARIRKFKDQFGQYLWQTSANTEEPGLILGFGYDVDENMPNVAANAYPVAFADWKRSYLIADRTGMRLLRDPYTMKPFILFYNTRRVGGGVQNFESIKLLKVAAS